VIKKPDQKTRKSNKTYTFDAVFPPNIGQKDIYEHSAFHLVESVAEGFNGTIFAYG